MWVDYISKIYVYYYTLRRIRMQGQSKIYGIYKTLTKGGKSDSLNFGKDFGIRLKMVVIPKLSEDEEVCTRAEGRSPLMNSYSLRT